ncbi:MAG: ABC transporter permease [Cyclobacteriaceae bacterium]|jgi:putative ABC transport system permease protein
MIQNNFKTAIRNIKRHRFFSLINIFGLAIGLTVSLSIIMLVSDQFMYDRFNSKRDQIYRIDIENLDDNYMEMGDKYATAPMPLRDELKNGYTGIQEVVRFKKGFANSWIQFENNNLAIPLTGYFADAEVLNVFEYQLEYGNAQSALQNPFSVVLTKKAAKKLFNKENPIGETIAISDEGVYKVTGVLKEFKNKTHVNFEALASMSTVNSLSAKSGTYNELDDWQAAWNGWVYVQVTKDFKSAQLQDYLDAIQKKKYPHSKESIRIKFFTQMISEITPGEFLRNPIGPMLPWMFVYSLAGLSFIIVISSCFNFTNLSMAKSLSRAREIGVRKTFGAARIQLFFQFITESVVTAWMALILALVILVLFKPLVFNFSIARMLEWDWTVNYVIIIVFVLFATLVGIIAGLFPAVVLSGLQPSKVLRDIGNSKLFSRVGLRKVLIVIQFTFSLIFILTLIVINNQLSLFMKADHGFDMKNKISLKLSSTSFSAIKNEILKNSNIGDVSAASHLAASGTSYGSNFKVSSEKEWNYLDYYAVDEDYLKNMGIVLLNGRFFDPAAGDANRRFIVLNEEAVATLKLENATDLIGTHLLSNKDSLGYEIIGIVKNYNHQMLTSSIGPMALIYNPAEFSLLQVKYNGTYAAAAKSISEAWLKVNPQLKPEINDFESEVKMSYHFIFGDLVNLLFLITLISIAISSFGLLGMAVYATEARVKEIAIRKILGANNFTLIYLLSKSFLWLMLIAVILALPIAYIGNIIWLQTLAYHTSFNLEVVLSGIGILVGLMSLILFSQTIRARQIDPIKNLKSE